jgi:dsRNA-specific ribonuclease
MIMMEAMTAPTANKPIDYERLEFYGDSVISFVVILELFLTTASQERSYNEGELDFLRIKSVSNMNLAQTNEKHKIYEYIITDSTKVVSDEL